MIVDELVLAIRLDKSNFEGDKASVLKELEGLKESAKGTAEDFQKALKGLSPEAFRVHNAALKTAQEEWSKLRKAQEQLAQQSFRTGAAVKGSGATPPVGLQTITKAALAAHAAIKSVQGIIGSVSNAAAGGPAQLLSVFKRREPRTDKIESENKDDQVIKVGLDESNLTRTKASVQKELDDLKESAKGPAEDFQKALKRLSPEAMRIYSAALKKAESEWGKYGEGANKVQRGLSGQARRTGEAVKAGGNTGALGLQSIATAALSAYAAIKSVQGIIGSVGSAAAGGAQTGRSAFLSGVSVQWLSAFEQYALKAGNVSPETTEGLVGGFAQKLQAYKQTGEYAPEFTSLARFAGIGDISKLTVDQLIAKLSSVVGKEGRDGPLAQFLSTQFGFGPLATVLAKGPQAYQRGIQEHMSTAVTPQQTQDLQKLQGAVNDVMQAWDSLVRRVISDNPQWTTFLGTFHNWLVDLQSTPEGLHAVETAAKAVSTAIGITLAAAMLTMARAVLEASAMMLTTPLGRLLLLGVAVVDAFDDKKNAANLERFKKDQQADIDYKAHTDEYDKETNQSLLSRAKHRLLGYKSDPKFQEWMKSKGYDIPTDMVEDAKGAVGDIKSFWRSFTNPSAAPPNVAQPSATLQPSADPRGVVTQLRASAQRYGLNPDDVQRVAQAEGLGAKRYDTWVVDSRGRGAFNYGALQARQGGMADEFQRDTGLDPSNSVNEIALNDYLLAYGSVHGFRGKWESVSKNIVAEPRRISVPDATAAASYDTQPVDQTTRYTKTLQTQPVDQTQLYATAAQTQRSLLTAATNRNFPSGGTNTRSTEVNIGSIQVVAPSNDPAAMGNAVSQTIKANMLTSNVNSGLE